MSSADVDATGAPCVIGAVIVRELRASADLAGVRVLDNPTRAADLQDGERVLFFEDQYDRLRDNPAQVAQRTYGFTLGVISRVRAGNARERAHTDYRSAQRVLRRACMAALTEAGVQINGAGLREGDVSYRVEGIDVGGALVLGSYTLDYRNPL